MDTLNAALRALETPCLILDRDKLQYNADRFLNIAAEHGVALRPHLKTAKSVDVARIVTGHDTAAKITVSTLLEAEYFSSHGFDDILYAVGISLNKLPRVAKLTLNSGSRVMLVTDNVPMATAAVAFAEQHQVSLEFLIEVDCGDSRSGVGADSNLLLAVAEALQRSSYIQVRGVMTHAGHAYASQDPQVISKIAEDERAAVVLAAERLSAAGIDVNVVSLGSTPTVACAKDFRGVTEVRCGVYPFFDLDQYGRGTCEYQDLALSVLATVTGHQPQAGHMIIDAGGLALSKDIGANGFLPDAGYGYVCDAQTLEQYPGLSVTGVSQEHGKISVTDLSMFERLPIGSPVRILPNHACFTAAAYPNYHILQQGRLVANWPRVNGW